MNDRLSNPRWYRSGIAAFLAFFLVAGSFASSAAAANDFPTQARVEFVLGCMADRGGQSYDTLYPCICQIDRIAANMPYDEYTAAETLSFLYSTAGERGGIFRDAAPRSRQRINLFRAVRNEAEDACFVSAKRLVD
ncbi:hypothetical protein [Thioalkalivibrio sp. HK1]|uniref:hypothetical protein n=1 Tax=Thioalkalivibrio sp. HK1 TaxID=1469245 RepID=UPI0004707037|nr:hypothetical protein [Thioalkalivibrio sp. HK1]